jgi:hypothetical protein
MDLNETQVLKNIREDFFSLIHSIHRRISSIFNIKDRHLMYKYYFFIKMDFEKEPPFS